MAEPLHHPQNTVAGLLAWYSAMGVDAAVDEDSAVWTDRKDGPGAHFNMLPRPGEAQAAASVQSPLVQPQQERPGTVPKAPLPSAATVQRQFTAQRPDAAVMSARKQAESAATLTALVDILAAFDGCGLKTTATNLCVYRGAPQAKLMVIGEAPGREEDLAGEPFVGPAGQLLDAMLKAAGLAPETLHITNSVYWRPPGNRAPTPEETEICRPFLERQIALVKPEVVFVLGGTAAKTVFGVTEGITRVRGQWHDLNVNGHKVRGMASLHPAYLLRTPAAKRQAWRDMLAVREAVSQVA